jgi:ubiquinone/menaquinone biosynthesis C-methylase UbiE
MAGEEAGGDLEGFGQGYVRLDDAHDPDALLHHLDAVSSTPLVAEVKRRTTAALELEPGSRAIDIGCGTGVDALAMAEFVRPGGRLVAADLSERAVRVAGRRLAGIAEAEAIVADAQRLPFADASFDALRAERTLLHVADPARALEEFRRVLAPRGRIAILELGRRLEGDPELLRGAAYAAVSARYWSDAKRVSELALFLPVLLPRAGFTDVRVERLGGRTEDFTTADALLRLREGAHDAVAAGTVTAGQGEAWLASVRDGMAAGRLSLAIGATLFTARAAT